MTKFGYITGFPGCNCPRHSGEIVLGAYPSGEPLVSIAHDAAGTLMLQTTSVADLMTVLFWVDAMMERRPNSMAPRFILPFVPGARQDRLNGSSDYLFTAKSVAREINARRFHEVIVVDPHSDVITALIDRCRVVHSDALVNPPAGKYAAVVAPDGGAEKRAARVAKKLGVPLLHAWKTRDPKDGALTGFGIEPFALPPNSRILMVDDICDGGGTFVGLSGAVTQYTQQSGQPRVKRDLFVTHGLFTKGFSVVADSFDHVYCTDLVGPLMNASLGMHDGIIVVPAAQKLLEGAV